MTIFPFTFHTQPSPVTTFLTLHDLRRADELIRKILTELEATKSK